MWELMLATKFGNPLQMVTKVGSQILATKFGYVLDCWASDEGMRNVRAVVLVWWMMISLSESVGNLVDLLVEYGTKGVRAA